MAVGVHLGIFHCGFKEKKMNKFSDGLTSSLAQIIFLSPLSFVLGMKAKLSKLQLCETAKCDMAQVKLYCLSPQHMPGMPSKHQGYSEHCNEFIAMKMIKYVSCQ